jgi:guanidinoacetate N-methyltransferase
MSPAAVRAALDQTRDPRPGTPDRIVDRDRFRVELHTKSEDFAATPRAAQRKWMISQAMEEIADDLAFIDQVASTLVKGHDHQLADDLKDITQSSLTDQEIMEDWQTPLMKAMALAVTETHGDILEIGFGRGVSAEFIQMQGVRSHTVVEMNRHSIDHYFAPWRKRHSSSDIRLAEGRWQDVLDQLGLYDGIFFHAFPLNEEEFTKYVLESITFAEHAFEPMANLLKPGGSFTYLTTEINSLSRRHQRRLFQHFRSIYIQVEKLSIPPDTRDTWWADEMVVIRAVK